MSQVVKKEDLEGQVAPVMPAEEEKSDPTGCQSSTNAGGTKFSNRCY